MGCLYDYSDLLALANGNSGVRRGVVVDTNVLIAATYDPDRMNEFSGDLLDLIFEEDIPIYCNFNTRMEFLEIYRRIILTEALLEFSVGPVQKFLSETLTRRLKSVKTKNIERERKNQSPFRFGEKDLKEIMLELVKISDDGRDLWTVLCVDRVGGKLEAAWTNAEAKFGLNFMDSPRSQAWEDAVHFMEQHGLSSSDAMILNEFLVSKFSLLISNDSDLGLALLRLKPLEKNCIVPKEIKDLLLKL